MMVEDRTASTYKQVDIAEDQRCPGDWRVEAVGLDGEVFVTIFSGPEAKAEAQKYRIWRFG